MTKIILEFERGGNPIRLEYECEGVPIVTTRGGEREYIDSESDPPEVRGKRWIERGGRLEISAELAPRNNFKQIEERVKAVEQANAAPITFAVYSEEFVSEFGVRKGGLPVAYNPGHKLLLAIDTPDAPEYTVSQLLSLLPHLPNFDVDTWTPGYKPVPPESWKTLDADLALEAALLNDQLEGSPESMVRDISNKTTRLLRRKISK